MTTASDPSWGATFPGGTGASSQPREPSTAGVWIGVLILVVGLIGAGVWFVNGILGLGRRINDLPRFTVPGQITVSLDPGTYHLYAEYPDAADDAGPAGAMSPIVVTDSRGEPIAVSASTEFTYSFGTHVGRSAGEFTVDESGLYTVSAQVDSTSIETIDVAIARNGIIDAGSIIGSVFGSIALGAVVTLVGIILIIVTLVRRSRWRRQYRPRGGPPWSGGGPGYMQPGYIPPGYGPPAYTPPGYGPPGYPGAGHPAPGYGQPPPGPAQAPSAPPWPPPPPPGSGAPPWEQPTASPWDPPASPPPGRADPWSAPAPTGSGGSDAPGWAAPGAAEGPGPFVAPGPTPPPPEPGAEPTAPGGAGLGAPPAGQADQDDAATAPGSAGLGTGGLGGAGVAGGGAGPTTSTPGGAGLGGGGLGAAGVGGSAAPGGAGLEGPTGPDPDRGRPTIPPPRRGLAPGELPPGWGPPAGTPTADEAPDDRSDGERGDDPGSGTSP